jgi:hypothetical protein
VAVNSNGKAPAVAPKHTYERTVACMDISGRTNDFLEFALRHCRLTVTLDHVQRGIPPREEASREGLARSARPCS